MKTSHFFRHLLLLSALATGTAAHAERTYKWTDANGRVNYSNRMPPESVQQERREINEQGRVIKVYSAPLTPEEKVEAHRLAGLAAKKQERARKRAIHDRSLLATYSNIKDMKAAQKDKIFLIESIVHLTNRRIKSMQERLLAMSEEAAQFERSGKRLPFTLSSQISNLRDQIAHNKRFSQDKETETGNIRQQFKQDIERYTELTSDDVDSTRQGPTPLELASNNPKVTLNRHDRTLLTTFTSVEDLLFARNEEVGNIDFKIKHAYDRIDTMQTHLAELSNNADEYEVDGEVLPDSLVRQMKQVMSEISTTEQMLQKKRSRKQLLLSQFEQDIDRFKLLTASN